MDVFKYSKVSAGKVGLIKPSSVTKLYKKVTSFTHNARWVSSIHLASLKANLLNSFLF
jgi:hypothetical protein